MRLRGLPAGLLLLAACSTSFHETPWPDYSSQLLEEARARKQAVILDFSADWCVPCKELSRFTLGDPRVVRTLNDFVKLRVDLTDYESEHSRSLRRQYGITGVPELVFLGPSGQEIKGSRVIGFMAADAFLEHLKTIRHQLRSPGPPAPSAGGQQRRDRPTGGAVLTGAGPG